MNSKVSLEKNFTKRSLNSNSGLHIINNNSKSFLKFLYLSIKKMCNNNFDMFTLTQISNFPLIISEKLIYSLIYNDNNNNNNNNYNDNNDMLNFNSEKFIYCFYNLYFGTIYEKIKIISNLCCIKNNYIYLNDIKILLIHFHMRVLCDDSENYLYELIENFFNKKEKMKKENFIMKCIEKNYDIIYIFLTFFEKFSFFNKNHIKIFENSKINEDLKFKESSFNNNYFEEKSTFEESTSIFNNSNNNSYINLNNNNTITNNNNNSNININNYYYNINNNSSIGNNSTKENSLIRFATDTWSNKKYNNINNNINEINEKNCKNCKISDKCINYCKLIKEKIIMNDPFEEDEDNEMREILKNFEDDIINTKHKYFDCSSDYGSDNGNYNYIN